LRPYVAKELYLIVGFQGSPLAHERIELLEYAYGLNKTENAEITFSFLLIGIKAKWKPIIEKALAFVQSTGRIKFVKPVYKKMFDWPEARDAAIEVFNKNRPFMHPITVLVVKSQI
jgi:leukotriene-A4 hydrolase